VSDALFALAVLLDSPRQALRPLPDGGIADRVEEVGDVLIYRVRYRQRVRRGRELPMPPIPDARSGCQ
jgi:hypothetical protein